MWTVDNCFFQSGRGGWLSYGIGVVLLHLVIRILPFLDNFVVWTVTNVLHDLVRSILALPDEVERSWLSFLA